MLLSRRLPASVLLLPLCHGFAPSFQSQRIAAVIQQKRPSASSFSMNSKNAARHDVGSSAQMELSPAEQAKMEAYGQHQTTAPKLGFAADIRSLIAYNHGFAVISTFSKADSDYPGGSVVGFAPDEQGRPLFIFSGMSSHTQDILANPHCSLTVAARDFKGAADARVNLMGRVELIKDSNEKAAAKACYMKKHPGAFWVDFGDFNWFRMTVDKVRFVGGFARAGSVTAAEYTAATPDPVAEFSADIASHMNEDHMPATIAMVQTNVPGMEPDPDNPITEALITSVDTLGMFIKVTRDKPVKFLPQQFKLRLPFPRPAESRKDVKMLIVELCQPKATTAATETSSSS
jgi:putative heme iron utilization protein